MVTDLTIEQKCKLLLGMTTLAERWESITQNMIDVGFTSLKPKHESRYALCNADEIDSFREYLIEEIKEHICDPTGRLSPLFGNTPGYKSPYLERLRNEREVRLGCSFEEARTKGIQEGQSEIHPALIRARGRPSDLRSADDDVIQTAWKNERQLELMRFKNVHIAGLPLPGIHAVDEFPELVNISRHHEKAALSLKKLHFDVLQKFYVETVTEAFQPLGFEYSPLFSKETYPAFAKQVHQNWYLVLSNEMFSGQDLVDSLDSTQLVLSIRSKRCKGPLNKVNESRHIRLRIEYLVPFISGWYRKFRSYDELNVIIQANATLYGLIANDIERVLRDGLVQLLAEA